MVTNQLCTPTKGNMSHFITRNPFETLNKLVEPGSDGSGALGSSTSSNGSTLQHAHTGTGALLVTPSRGLVSKERLSQQYHDMSNMTPQRSHLAIDTRRMPSVFTSPAPNRTPSTAAHSYSSPQAMTTLRRDVNNLVSLGSPPGPVLGQRRDSFPNPVSPASYASSGRASFSSSLRAPTMFVDPNGSSLAGVPEVLAVQEMAFRQGQHDHRVCRERVPSSPFAKHFDQVWVHFYNLGKACGGDPIPRSPTTPSSQQANFPWPILINPYTQDLERPEGTVDAAWVRKICVIALSCMAALIGTVCKRRGDWRKTICDVPAQIQHALSGFPDLRSQYQTLQQDAREAIGGGLPSGYLPNTA
ncbi:hypothetical protein GQ44DRAFT_642516 [Phaeosphaeriaceae sp. PMI808]|nr:hypothetical protein GQ44DRAFT_642516 [Phaeosphaeriaceae sp. PMI808]